MKWWMAILLITGVCLVIFQLGYIGEEYFVDNFPKAVNVWWFYCGMVYFYVCEKIIKAFKKNYDNE